MNNKRGFTILECITYVAVLLLVLSGAFASYSRCQLGSSDLRRNAEDIVNAMHAGERWRADIRAAIQMPRLTPGGIIIPQQNGEIAYEINDGTMWRQTARDRIAVLKRVRNSTMQRESRGIVTAWRWEVELVTGKRTGNLRPLFTFEATEGKRL